MNSYAAFVPGASFSGGGDSTAPSPAPSPRTSFVGDPNIDYTTLYASPIVGGSPGSPAPAPGSLHERKGSSAGIPSPSLAAARANKPPPPAPPTTTKPRSAGSIGSGAVGGTGDTSPAKPASPVEPAGSGTSSLSARAAGRPPALPPTPTAAGTGTAASGTGSGSSPGTPRVLPPKPTAGPKPAQVSAPGSPSPGSPVLGATAGQMDALPSPGRPAAPPPVKPRSTGARLGSGSQSSIDSPVVVPNFGGISPLETRADIVWSLPDFATLAVELDAGSLATIVEFATHRTQHARHQIQLIWTYRAFATASELLQTVLARYQAPVSDASDLAPIRLQTFNFIKRWFGERPSDIEADGVEPLLGQFIDQVLPSLDLARTAASLKRFVDQTREKCAALKEASAPLRQVALPSEFDWRIVPNMVLAEQITLMEFRLFCAIAPQELLNKAWSSADRASRAPNICAMISYFNATSAWIVTQVVREQSRKERTGLITRFIRLGDDLMRLGNISSLMAVVAALSTVEIRRLKRSWAKVQQAERDLFEAQGNFVSVKRNYAHIRGRLMSTSAAGVDGPFTLPYLGMLLSDLTFLEDGNPDKTESGLISWRKWRMVAGVIGLVTRHQSQTLQVAKTDYIVCQYLRDAERWPEERCYEESKLLEMPKQKKKAAAGAS